MTPLAKRLPRELRRNIGKYLGIFLLMCGSIALTSGFLLAAHSIGCLIDDMRDAYTIEDGRVTTSFEATDDQLKAAEDAADDWSPQTGLLRTCISSRLRPVSLGSDGSILLWLFPIIRSPALPLYTVSYRFESGASRHSAIFFWRHHFRWPSALAELPGSES